MIADDFLQESLKKGQYKLNDHGLIMTGIFQRKSNGKNSFIPEDGGETIFIAEKKLGTRHEQRQSQKLPCLQNARTATPKEK